MFDTINQINKFEDKEIQQAIIVSLEQQNLMKKKIQLIIKKTSLFFFRFFDIFIYLNTIVYNSHY